MLASVTSPRVRNQRRARGRPPGPSLTAERVLDAAVQAFSESGFHGVSLRDLARTIGVSAPALLHHFASKEKLYSAVLDRIRVSVEPVALACSDHGDPIEDVVAIVDGLVRWTREHDAYSRILLRELLDNESRALSARKWHLAPLVARLAERVRRAQGAGCTTLDAELFVFELVGAIAYFHAGTATIRRVTRRQDAQRLYEAFRAQITAGARLRLRAARSRAR